jgi:hypothetical protein
LAGAIYWGVSLAHHEEERTYNFPVAEKNGRLLFSSQAANELRNTHREKGRLYHAIDVLLFDFLLS